MTTLIVFVCERCSQQKERSYNGGDSTLPDHWARVEVRYRTAGASVVKNTAKVVCPDCRDAILQTIGSDQE